MPHTITQASQRHALVAVSYTHLDVYKRQILDSCGAHGLMISNIMGYGTQKGYTQMYRGTKYTVNLLPKVKVETVVAEDIVEAIISKVTEQILSLIHIYVFWTRWERRM